MSRSAPAITADLVQRLPKAELHCHLDGSVRPATLLELGREYGQPMPRDDPDALREFLVARDAGSLEEYLRAFTVTLSVMQRGEALERVAYELAEDAAREGVWYIEARYAPILTAREGLAQEESVDRVMRGLARAEREYGIAGRVLVCGIRTMRPDTSLEAARVAVSCAADGVAGFDLAGAERGYPAAAHAEAFRFARTHGLACTCHAGEAAGAPSVGEAIHACGATRIGHGTRLGEDEALEEEVRELGITVEACLTSNVQTGAVPSYDRHPARGWFERGLRVVLNTDNRLVSGTTLTEEYLLAARHLGFGARDLARLALQGFESAFLPPADRDPLVARARSRIAELIGDAA